MGGKPYPAIPEMWTATWEEFIPFLAYDVEIRRVLFSTNAIKSLYTRYRRAVTVHEHFPTEQAALKCLYLATQDLDPQGHESDTMNHAVEAHAQRFRRHPRQPDPDHEEPLKTNTRNTIHRTDPRRNPRKHVR